jgi:hypothetical protein
MTSAVTQVRVSPPVACPSQDNRAHRPVPVMRPKMRRLCLSAIVLVFSVHLASVVYTAPRLQDVKGAFVALNVGKHVSWLVVDIGTRSARPDPLVLSLQRARQALQSSTSFQAKTDALNRYKPCCAFGAYVHEVEAGCAPSHAAAACRLQDVQRPRGPSFTEQAHQEVPCAARQRASMVDGVLHRPAHAF